jgi:hypothetical protein
MAPEAAALPATVLDALAALGGSAAGGAPAEAAAATAMGALSPLLPSAAPSAASAVADAVRVGLAVARHVCAVLRGALSLLSSHPGY